MLASFSKLSPSGTYIQNTTSRFNFDVSLDVQLNCSLSSAVSYSGRPQLIDITGQIIFEKLVEIKNGFNKNEIQIPALSPAVYLVRVRTDFGDITAKVIKK